MCRYGVFKVHGLFAPTLKGRTRGLSKLSSMQENNVEVDILLGDPVVRTRQTRLIDEPGASGVIAPESLERR